MWNITENTHNQSKNTSKRDKLWWQLSNVESLNTKKMSVWGKAGTGKKWRIDGRTDRSVLNGKRDVMKKEERINYNFTLGNVLSWVGGHYPLVPSCPPACAELFALSLHQLSDDQSNWICTEGADLTEAFNCLPQAKYLVNSQIDHRQWVSQVNILCLESVEEM